MDKDKLLSQLSDLLKRRAAVHEAQGESAEWKKLTREINGLKERMKLVKKANV